MNSANQGNQGNQGNQSNYIDNDNNRRSINNIHEDRIIVEKHYIPISLYREIYGNQSIPIQNSTPVNIFRNNGFQQHFNLPYTPPVNIPYAPHVRIPESEINHHYDLFPNFRNNLFNNILNRNIPIEITNLPPFTMPFNIPFNIPVNNPQNLFNNTEQNINNGIPLSNINILTTVSRFCDFTETNISDNCSICQLAFNDNDICRLIKSCKHVFHLECIDIWFSDHITCPCCRHNLLSNTIINNQQEIVNEQDQNNEEDADYDEEYEEDYDEEYEEDYEEEYDEDYEAEYEAEYEEYEANQTDENLSNLVDNVINENNNVINENINIPYVGVFSNTSNIYTFNTQPLLNDINNFVNISTPFINSVWHNITPTSNTSSRLNSSHINTHINNHVNELFNNINPILNPLLQAFNNFNPR